MLRNFIKRVISKWRIRKVEKFHPDSQVILRKTRKGDEAVLDEIRDDRSPKLHTERLHQQEKGKALYLAAFIEKIPVGHIFISLDGTEEYHTSPVLQDLYVKKSLREQNLGTKIIQETERFLKKTGFGKVSLDVETRNDWIQKFYEKQGYKTKSGPHKQSWIERDLGKNVEIKTIYLEKDI